MKSKASAPGKIILFGEHFVVYGTNSILCAIDRRTTVVAETVPEKLISIHSELGNDADPPDMDFDRISAPHRPLYYLARRLADQHGHDGGISLHVSSEIPIGVGLGSSSACCVAAAAAISGLFEEPNRGRTLQLAMDAEKTIHEKSSGADCTASVHGGLVRYSKRDHSRIRSSADLKLTVANSGTEHSTADMVRGVSEFREQNHDRFIDICSEAEDLIRDALHMIRRNNLQGLGRCMSMNQRLLREIGASTEELDSMTGIADRTSLGSKMTGAGGGGCIVALNAVSAEHTLDSLVAEGYECFHTEIDFKGLDTF